MNSEVINRLSIYGIPSTSHSNHRIVQTQTINQFGDICILTNSKTEPVVFSNLRSVSNHENVTKLPLNISLENFHSYHFCNIAFNDLGNCLLVWGDAHVGVIAIPRSLTIDGSLYVPNGFEHVEKDQKDQKDQQHSNLVCHFELLAEEFLSTKPMASLVVKVLFHSLSSYHVIILLQHGPLLMVDIIRDVTQTITLPRDKNYTSCCCGPLSSDWLRYTIFVTTDNNQVYVLCPIIPYGLSTSSHIGEDLWLWFEDQCQSGVRESYLQEVHMFLKSVFPSSSSCSSNQSLEFAMSSMSLSSRLKPFKSSLHTPMRKPFDAEGPPEISDYSSLYVSRSNEREKQGQSESNHVYMMIQSLIRPVVAQGPLPFDFDNSNSKSPKNLIGNQSSITDICCIQSNSMNASNAPVLMLSYNNGDIDVCILTNTEETSLSFVNPMWEDMNTSTLSDVPTLVVGDSIRITSHRAFHEAKSSSHDKWFIIADPVYPHYIHIYGHKGSTYGVFTVISNWLQHAISGKIDDLSSSSSIAPSIIPIYTNTSNMENTLKGLDLICDPILGHMITFRTSSSESTHSAMGAIHLTAHIKLYELELTTNSILDKSMLHLGESESKSNGIDERRAQVLDEMTTKGIASLREAIHKIPKPASDYIPTMTETKSVHDLQAANQYVSDSVILPFEELGQRLLFRMETIYNTLCLQQELLEDSNDSHSSHSRKKTTGLKQKLESLASIHEQLHIRLDSIQQTHEEQKAILDKLYLVAASKRSKISEDEKRYKVELQEWMQELKAIESLIDKIKRQRIASGLMQSHQKESVLTSQQSISPTPGDYTRGSPIPSGTSVLFSPPSNSRRGLFTMRPVSSSSLSFESTMINQDPTNDDLSRIYRSPNASNLSISRFSQGSTITPVTGNSTSSTPLSITNLRPNLRSPYKPTLVHSKSKNTPPIITKLSPA